MNRRVLSRAVEGPAGPSDSAVLNRHPGPLYTVVSFFAGCGGMDLGFLGGFKWKHRTLEPLPFEIKAAYDFDDKCIFTYKRNIGSHAEVRDLSCAKPGDLPKADVLMGGFPCQDFSSCGPKRGLASGRGRLYESMIAYMKHHRPRIVVGENVPHLARLGGGSVMEKIVEDFENAGYSFEVWELHAPDYGIPQNRKRLFFVGVRSDLDGRPQVPKRTHASKHLSIDWAIGDLAPITDETVSNQSQYFKASKAKRGNGQGDEKSRAGEPSYTIRANAKSRVQFHYALRRRLTVRECARLQTFPDGFVFPFSATSNVMQIGNAVPPLLAHHVARAIAAYLDSLGTGVQ